MTGDTGPHLTTPAVQPDAQSATPSRPLIILSALAPFVLLALAFVWLVNSETVKVFESAAPPIEQLTVERVILDNAGIAVKLRAGGSSAMTVAQVQVDSAYWTFEQTPPGPLARLSVAWLRIPYPWLRDEAHTLTFVTDTGATFEHVIEVAIPSPSGGAGAFWSQALLGGFVGILPVAIGMLFFPLLQRLRRDGMQFVLAVTLGMLGFLLIDVTGEAFESASKAATAFQGPALVLLVAGSVFLLLIAIGRRNGAPDWLALAMYVALGIGLHNLGEGLAIGSALAAGAASLGTFLIMGFTLHNVTEGIAISAPLVRGKPTLPVFAGLALLAGAPAILGIWLGSNAIAPQWSALAFAVGAGAILQVLFEVGAYIARNRGPNPQGVDRNLIAGVLCGVLVMYLTGLAIKV